MTAHPSPADRATCCDSWDSGVGQVRAAGVRRRPVLGAGISVAATALVSACGGSNASGGSSAAPKVAAGEQIVALSKVPVGGAVSAQGPGGQPLIVVQPAEGEVVVLSAVCTHMGCTVAPAGKELDCPCHGSKYDLTGKNIAGPAPRPLAKVAATVKDGTVVTA